MHKRSIAPRIETLEGRELLAAKLVPQITFNEFPVSTSQYELIITGTSKNDSVFVADNGTGSAGNMMVITGKGITYTSVHAISTLAVITGKGKDNVTYELQGDLAPKLKETVVATSGTGNIPFVDATKGGGTLSLTANVIGKITSTAGLAIAAYADPKSATTANINGSGDIDGRLVAGVIPGKMSVSSGYKTGTVNFNFRSSAVIGTNGKLYIQAVGGSHKNNFSTLFSGSNRGDITLLELASGASDRIATDLNMDALSAGTVGGDSNATISDTGKKANVRFTIHRGANSTSTIGISASIGALSRKSTATQTANVTNDTSGKDTIIG
jgi:hypothetical protein